MQRAKSDQIVLAGMKNSIHEESETKQGGAFFDFHDSSSSLPLSALVSGEGSRERHVSRHSSEGMQSSASKLFSESFSGDRYKLRHFSICFCIFFCCRGILGAN